MAPPVAWQTQPPQRSPGVSVKRMEFDREASPDTAHLASSTRSGGLRLRGIRGLREHRSEEDDVISIARFMTRREKP